MSKMTLLVENKILVSETGRVLHKHEQWQFACVVSPVFVDGLFFHKKC
jgi:hypothetical protein